MNGRLQADYEAAKRKRHKSAVEKSDAKPSRSLSIYSDWRPGKDSINPPTTNGSSSSEDSGINPDHVAGDASCGVANEDASFQNSGFCDSQAGLTAIKDLVSTSQTDSSSLIVEKDDSECDSSAMCSVVANDSFSFESKSANTVNNSNLALTSPASSDDRPIEFVAKVYSNESDVCSEFDPLASKSASTSGQISPSDTANHPLREGGESGSGVNINASHSLPTQANTTTHSDLVNLQSHSQPTAPIKILSDTLSLQEESTTDPDDPDVSLSKRDIRRSVSISEDQFSLNQINEAAMKQSLSTAGRTLSSDSPMEKKVSPVKRLSEDAQSVSSLSSLSSLNEMTPKRERPSDFVLRRSQSLKKTNDAIGSFLKYASKAAFTKLNELKQTITTPIKNGSLGSLGSLTHSVEELDGNDGSSTSGTIKERLRYGGSQDLLSHSEESETDQSDRGGKRNSGVSFGELKSGLVL